ncbi:hypothetical protein O181_062147 [Austropuccinia psidii MF-1]|uniref:Uncharacterized protein n=1 Tax=Austropuccinia psidii MF-1 TaxID=1389203 RepID=A0A9Q3I036_9BASI|nr:hypothetical protein [Austropuccinia psidii MF-1]
MKGYDSSSSAPPTPQRSIPMENEQQESNLAPHCAELGASWQRICVKEIPFKYLIVITKGWNSNRKLQLLKERATRITENKATIQAIE